MAKQKNQTIGIFTHLLPLLIVTVCIVFSFVFTVMLIPLGSLTADIKLIFVLLLIVTTTVASVVSIIYYLFILKKLAF